LSDLKVDIEKEAIALYHETISYQTLLLPLVSSRFRLPINLDINGRAIAPSFKFNKIDFDDSNNMVSLDVSTSRASAWSAFGDPEISVYYGGDLEITSGNTIELSSIEFLDEDIIEKRFDSQIPTHTIPITIDGTNYEMFAMKGIPLIFTGFFRSSEDMMISYDDIAGLTISPSWVIYPIDGSESEIVYRNIGSNNESSIDYYKNTAKERNVEIYYPIDLITEIQLTEMNIKQFPEVIMDNLRILNIQSNDLIEMPDFSQFNSLITLNISDNDLTRSSEGSLKSLSNDVVARLPNSLRTLTAQGCYTGDTTANFETLTNLVTLNLYSGVYNSRRMTGTSPAIGTVGANPSIATSVKNYNISYNRFSQLHESVQKSNTLETIDIRSNSISGDVSFESNNLISVRTGGNSHSPIDLSGKTNLRTYITDSMTFSGNTDVSGIVVGCSSLEEYRINNTNASGPIPNFSTNTSLRLVTAWSTRFSDAIPGQYSIGPDTFSGCRETLDYFNVASGYLESPMHPEAFHGMNALRTIRVSSANRGITGDIPDMSQCPDIRRIIFDRNQLSGEIPNISASRLWQLHLADNELVGAVPALELPSLRYLTLYRNNLTRVNALNCPNLFNLHLSNNLLESFPDFPNFTSTGLKYIYMSRAFADGSSVGYQQGTFAGLTSLYRLNLNYNNLTQGVVNSILYDLNENYNNRPRSGVRIDLIGNATPSQTDEILAIIARLRNNGWIIGI
jgi:hypothetical protein